MPKSLPTFVFVLCFSLSGVFSISATAQAAPAKPQTQRKVLIFTRTKGFRHGSIPTGAKSLAMLGEATGAYTAVHSEDPAMFEADKLKEFDAVFFVNTTGECLDEGARAFGIGRGRASFHRIR